jgi:hypothetical protein
MNPIKKHRTVRHGTAMIGRDRYGAAIESAENEGWPPLRSHAVLMRWPGPCGINGEARAKRHRND